MILCDDGFEGASHFYVSQLALCRHVWIEPNEQTCAMYVL